MANLYGVANPVVGPAYTATTGFVPIACPAGVETNFGGIAPSTIASPGWYYPFATGTVSFTCGATPPTGINWSIRIGTGADIGSITTMPAWLTASANLCFPLLLYGSSTAFNNPAPTLVVNISANPAGQAITVSQYGTNLWIGWMRAPDQ